MNKTIAKLFFLLALAIPFLPTFAKALDSGPFPLTGGQVPPKSELDVLLKGLPIGGMFKISCDIINPSNTKQYPIVLNIAVITDMGPPTNIYVNGDYLNQGQAKLSEYKNSLLITNYAADSSYQNPRVVFKSFDDSDTATVENCVAEFS